MYVQYPYKFDGKYYAKIDGNFYEISKEVAMAMFNSYRREVYRSRKWSPEVDETEEDVQEENNILKQFKELEREEMNLEVEQTLLEPKKKKRKTKYVEVLDCVFSENAEGVGVEDLPDDAQKSVEDQAIDHAEIEKLHIFLESLSDLEKEIVDKVFYKGMSQNKAAEQMDMYPQTLNKRLQIIYRKLRTMFKEENL